MNRKNEGFTLAELLIVVAIIAVLVAIAIPVFSAQLEKSRRAVDLSNARCLQSCLVNLYNDGTIQFENDGVVWVIVTKDQAYFCTNGKAWPKVNGKTGQAAANELEALINDTGLTTKSLKVNCKDSSKNWSLYLVYFTSDGKYGAYSTTDTSKTQNNYCYYSTVSPCLTQSSNLGTALKG